MECTDLETKDWVESAILLAHDLPLKAIRRERGICFFLFDHGRKALDLLESYWQGDLEGNLREFVEAQRLVKDLIHKEYANGKVNRPHQQYIEQR